MKSDVGFGPSFFVHKGADLINPEFPFLSAQPFFRVGHVEYIDPHFCPCKQTNYCTYVTKIKTVAGVQFARHISGTEKSQETINVSNFI